jgi:RNA polymerase sigma-70 factor (ECF subfamily)
VAKFWSLSVSNEPGELWLDGDILRDMQQASLLEQKVSELFELLRDPIYRYVRRLIGRRAEAEDLTQETFLRLYDSLQKGQAMGNVRPWLYRVAHNLTIDWLRQQGRLEQIEEDTLQIAITADAAPDAEQRLLVSERRRRLSVALSQLSPQQRHCLFLRAEGLGYREIGEVLGIGTSTVATYLGRAIKRIAEDVNEQ